MRVLIQRVRRASVSVSGERVAAIARGYLALVGVILMVILWIAKPEFFKRRPETWPGEGQPIPYSEERVSE